LSEQRFVVGSNEIGEIIVTDVETGNVYRYDNIYKFFGLIRLLNEQQTTIRKQKETYKQKKHKGEALQYKSQKFNYSWKFGN